MHKRVPIPQHERVSTCDKSGEKADDSNLIVDLLICLLVLPLVKGYSLSGGGTFTGVEFCTRFS